MADEVPKVFGREMVRSQNANGSWSLRFASLWVIVLPETEEEDAAWWIGTTPSPGEREDCSGFGVGAADCALAVERELARIVESLGPLVGWAPKGGADAG